MNNAVHEERFLRLLDEHRKILWKVASSWCRDAEERQDLEQEIVVQLWRSFGRYDSRFRFSTWMYRIAMNVAISFHRGAKQRVHEPLVEQLVEIAAPEGDSDEVRALRQRIDALEPLNKALILLYLDGHDHAAIGEILGITTTNVATKLARLKARLKGEIDGTR
jgi:RNA polymerase sigma factor (sigma-70 family)